MTFYYNKTDENFKHMAGVMAVGHHVTPNMLIPPQSERYTVTGQCSSDCTKKVIISFIELLKLCDHEFQTV